MWTADRWDLPCFAALAFILAIILVADYIERVPEKLLQSRTWRQIVEMMSVLFVNVVLLLGIEHSISVTVGVFMTWRVMLGIYYYVQVLKFCEPLPQHVGDLTAKNRYQNFLDHRYPVVFVGQSILTYFLALYTMEEFIFGPEQYSYWALSFPIQILAVTQAGGAFDEEIGFWKDAFCGVSKYKEPGLSCADKGNEGSHRIGWCTVQMRFTASFIVNSLFRSAMLFGLPLVLMRIESNFDFVKDSVAVLYISSLDDLPEPFNLRWVQVYEDLESRPEHEDPEIREPPRYEDLESRP